MSDDEIAELRRKYDPTPTLQDVRIVKPIVMEAVRAAHPAPKNFHSLVEIVVTEHAKLRFLGVPAHQSREPPEIVSPQIRWAAAVAEALDVLHVSGLIRPRSPNDVETLQSIINYDTGRSRGHWTYFEERGVYRQWLLTMRAEAEPDRDFLFEPDLYLERAGLDNAHQRIRTSITQAVAAYRQELYLAAATMLGSASEGAWLQFFEAFAVWATQTGSIAPTVTYDTLRGHVQNVMDKYRHFTGFKDVMKRAGLGELELRALTQHYDYLRDVRNYAAHFDKTERFDLTYAGVGILLLEAARYFATLYRLRATLT